MVGELRGGFSEDLEINWLHYNGTALYYQNINAHDRVWLDVPSLTQHSDNFGIVTAIQTTVRAALNSFPKQQAFGHKRKRHQNWENASLLSITCVQIGWREDRFILWLHVGGMVWSCLPKVIQKNPKGNILTHVDWIATHWVQYIRWVYNVPLGHSLPSFLFNVIWCNILIWELILNGMFRQK